MVDLASRALVGQIPVGNAPYQVLVAGTKAYVTNEGGRRPRAGDVVNDSSGTAIVADRGTGGAATGTISVIDLPRRAVVKTVAVGLHPTAMCLTGRTLFVANTNSDSVSALDTTDDRVVQTIPIQPFPHAPYGSSPNALVAVNDGRQLVVSLGRDNALAVYDWQGPAAPARLQGLIPTAWYPASVAFDPLRQTLIVANDKGVGSLGPPSAEGPDPKTNRTGLWVHSNMGSTSIIPFPSPEQLLLYTAF